jgi:predicted Zn-dependent protease
MKRAAFPFPLLSLALGIFFLHSASQISSPRPPARRDVRHSDVSSGTIARALRVVTPLAGLVDDDRADIKRRLHDAEAGTYIGDILRERDSSLARWPDRHGIPLTVWIRPRPSVKDYTPAYMASVRTAFQEWGSVHLPIRFSFVEDSADAEVHVNWIDHFNEPISGRTRWARDDDWVITDANITLALHHNQGELLDEDAMRAMAMHEIGHLLGLDHTTDSLSIMAPKVRVRDLSNADRATVRLIYALPAGPLGKR